MLEERKEESRARRAQQDQWTQLACIEQVEGTPRTPQLTPKIEDTASY